MLRFERVGTSQPKRPGKRFLAEGTARAQTISWKEEGITYKCVSRKMQLWHSRGGKERHKTSTSRWLRTRPCRAS